MLSLPEDAPRLLQAGHRVVAPDLIGFGRSDKPTEEAVYTFNFHRNRLLALFDRLDLRGIRLVCQDWGEILGLTLPMSSPARFSGLLVMNTTLGTGDVPLSEGFLAWRAFVRRQPDFDIAALMQRGAPGLSREDAAAYGSPFPDAAYKAGVRRFPEMLPDHPEAPGAALSRAAREWLKSSWEGKSLMAVGMKDPVLGRRPCATCTASFAIARLPWKSPRRAILSRSGEDPLPKEPYSSLNNCFALT